MRTFCACVVVGSTAMSLSGASPADLRLLTGAIHNPIARFALERAVRAAMDRLDDEECRNVLADFRDAAGQTIQFRLDRLGVTPSTYLATIAFREALDGRCRGSAMVAAFTFIGSPEVFVCSARFFQVYRANPSQAEALVIHEMMHTLGLGENPPSSVHITSQVIRRCW
jgi:hypothetical protein